MKKTIVIENEELGRRIFLNTKLVFEPKSFVISLVNKKALKL